MAVAQEAPPSVAVTTYSVPEYRLDAFTQVVERANRKAAKLGVAPFVMSVGGAVAMARVTTTVGGEGGSHIVTIEEAEAQVAAARQHPMLKVSVTPVNVFTVTVEGAPPQVAGWQFAASVDHDPAGNVVSQVPGSQLVAVADWVNAPADCAHCNLSRNRLKTYVLHEVATGGVKQVGSTCIQDFLGGNTAAQMAALAELWVTIEAWGGDEGDEYMGGAGGLGGYMREQVLAQAAAVVREVGFLGKAKAREQGREEMATVNNVTHALDWRPSRHEPERPFPVTPADAERAEAVVEWVEGLEPSPEQDYLWNLHSAVARPVTVYKMMGLVVSAVGAYAREMEWVARKEAEAAVEAVRVPFDGERVTVEGKVLSAQVREGDYGASLKLLLQIAHEGGAYKLWGNAPGVLWDAGVEAGDTVRFDAKVKRSDRDEAFGFWSRPTKASIVTKGGDA